MDVLADVLSVTRVSGTRLDELVACAPWGVRLPATPNVAFHVVTQGTCWITVPGHPPVQLVPGDIALIPTGASHTISNAPNTSARDYEELAAKRPSPPTAVGGRLEILGPGPETKLMCGGYTYDHAGAHPVLSLLPPIVHIPSSAAHTALSATLPLLAAEMRRGEPGAQTIVDRLVDVLFVQVLRIWSAGDDRAHWLGALRDPHIAKALSALHGRPAQAWTVATLAAVSGLSRASFAHRFMALVGEPPLAYLTRWRMDLAARRLSATAEPIAAVASSVGYTSEFAFSRAFRRVRGIPPGEYRLSSRTATLANRHAVQAG